MKIVFNPVNMYQRAFKPFFDFLISLVLLLALSPVFMLGVVLSTYSARGNPFFVHPRPGQNERIINVLKLKTMKPEIDPSGRVLGNAERITPIGRFLRSTSIDEIPQLLNVIKGDLSLVGPRPLQMWYLPFYNDFQRRRHNVRPGITGLAQIKGRNRLSWDDKFKLDVYYVEHVSLLLDLKILFLTPLKIFRIGDVNSGDSETMEAFVKKPVQGNSLVDNNK